ncbi:MAG TPA: serine/threonine-protein kinase [Flexivirga sp.]|uniref:serine/threonine-protein kinase n=1 Tax=Flexivirga sp. TaxID=1962927 RepID=UPI002D18E84D|nr:serine/threonine-protein kinase [Flexivirga sp.]HWC23379.1 serine/threonine-protein kinase [Flexivirga sp.]
MGEVFAGRYELIDIIGEGGMGSVWQVHDRKQDRTLAAKVLRQSDAGALLRFMREQSTRIHHPNVVTPIGWAGEDDRVLFTMPLVDGGAVSDLVRDHRTLPPRYVAELLRQLLRALDAVHDAGVIHRDVKPANLLLAATGAGRPHLMLTDFGIAVPTDSPRMTTTSVVLGTRGYLAPEQLAGADPAPGFDLYAAGIVAFQLLTAHRPDEIRRSRDQVPPRPDGIPDLLWRVVTDLADPDPHGRPPSAGAAADAMETPDLAWVEQREIVVPARIASTPVPDAVTHRPHRHAHDVTRTQRAPEAAPHRPAPQPRSSTGRKVGLVLVPVVATAALLGIWLPSTSDKGNLTPGEAAVGGTCQWQDAGTFENNASGSETLQCVSDGDTYTWQKP